MDSGIYLTLLGLAASSFVATNLDNLLLLVLLQAANPGRRSLVLGGYLLAVLTLLLVSLAAAAAGDWLDAGLVGWLGLVPLVLGARMWWRVRRAAERHEQGLQDLSGRTAPALLLGTFGVMLSNSGDSLALLLPLLADSEHASRVWLVAGWVACGLAWALLAGAVSGRGALARRIEQRGEKIVPWVMMAVGCYILLNTATDRLAG